MLKWPPNIMAVWTTAHQDHITSSRNRNLFWACFLSRGLRSELTRKAVPVTSTSTHVTREDISQYQTRFGGFVATKVFRFCFAWVHFTPKGPPVSFFGGGGKNGVKWPPVHFGIKWPVSPKTASLFNPETDFLRQNFCTHSNIILCFAKVLSAKDQ